MIHTTHCDSFTDLCVFVGDEATPIKLDVEREAGRLFLRNARIIFRHHERHIEVSALREANADKVMEAVREATR